MKRVGITGGVGSGKSHIARLFTLHGVPLLDSDSLAKKIMKSDTDVRTFLISQLGDDAYTKDGELNRPFISKKLFGDDDLRQKLNELVHPKVFEASDEWMLQYENTTTPYVLKEAALFVESGSYKDLDFLIGVFSPKDLRIQRLKESRAYTLEKTQSIMDSQLPDKELEKYCDFKISNNEEQSIVLQVEEIHHQILNS